MSWLTGRGSNCTSTAAADVLRSARRIGEVTSRPDPDEANLSTAREGCSETFEGPAGGDRADVCFTPDEGRSLERPGPGRRRDRKGRVTWRAPQAADERDLIHAGPAGCRPTNWLLQRISDRPRAAGSGAPTPSLTCSRPLPRQIKFVMPGLEPRASTSGKRCIRDRPIAPAVPPKPGSARPGRRGVDGRESPAMTGEGGGGNIPFLISLRPIDHVERLLAGEHALAVLDAICGAAAVG